MKLKMSIHPYREFKELWSMIGSSLCIDDFREEYLLEWLTVRHRWYEL